MLRVLQIVASNGVPNELYSWPKVCLRDEPAGPLALADAVDHLLGGVHSVLTELVNDTDIPLVWGAAARRLDRLIEHS